LKNLGRSTRDRDRPALRMYAAEKHEQHPHARRRNLREPGKIEHQAAARLSEGNRFFTNFGGQRAIEFSLELDNRIAIQISAAHLQSRLTEHSSWHRNLLEQQPKRPNRKTRKITGIEIVRSCAKSQPTPAGYHFGRPHASITIIERALRPSIAKLF